MSGQCQHCYGTGLDVDESLMNERREPCLKCDGKGFIETEQTQPTNKDHENERGNRNGAR